MAKFNFLKCRAKNFRSIGNAGMEIDYQANKSTLIASLDNGAGKSTMSIFAPFYALFGKNYQKGAKIGGLINTRSNKDSVVELDFETKGSVWTVKRGQKPAIFEIYQDGVRKDNEASVKDPQAYLESVIGFDEKAFFTTIALGVSRFVPFTEFSAAERRTFIENMLDLTIISDMSNKAKERIKVVKKLIDQTFYEGGTLESKLDARKRTLKILEDKKKARLAESGDELAGFVKEQTDVTKMLSMLNAKMTTLNESIVAGAETKYSEIKSMLDKFKFKIEQLKTNMNNITSLHDCPTCKQGVTEDHKSSIKNAAEESINNFSAPMEKLTKDLEAQEKIVSANNEVKKKINDLRVTQAQLEGRLSAANNRIEALKAKTIDANEDSLIEAEQKEINSLITQIKQKDDELQEHKKNELKHSHMLKILADDGAKAIIVEQYIPFLVEDMNATLDKLNLYLNIDLDSDANLSMRSPNRKNQTIDDLSTGQRRRLDLANLIAWRNIAKSKASVDVNILILDEILENLSASGVEEFMTMWNGLGEDTNLLVISQRHAEFEQYFDESIVYALKDDMTVLA